MDPQELSDIISLWYCDAPKDEQKTMLNLFGIVYADEIEKCRAKVPEIVRLSKIGDHYATKVYNGKRLARYVTVRPMRLSYIVPQKLKVSGENGVNADLSQNC